MIFVPNRNNKPDGSCVAVEKILENPEPVAHLQNAKRLFFLS